MQLGYEVSLQLVTSLSSEVLEMIFDVMPLAFFGEWLSVVDARIVSKLLENERPVHD